MPTVARHWIAGILPFTLAGLVITGGLAATLLLWDHERKRERELVEAAFAVEVGQVVTNLVGKLNAYTVVMRGLQGFFQGSDEVSYIEFLRYIRALDVTSELAGVQGLGWVVPVTRGQLPQHLAAIRAQLPVPYEIHPASQRELLAPIIYLEPLAEENLNAVGFDVFSNPVARAAAEQARDSGEMVITGALSLVQDIDSSPSPSFVMYLPVYRSGRIPATVAGRREALLGWVDVPFRMADLLASLRAEIDPDIGLEVRDGAPGEAAGLLYSTDMERQQSRSAEGELETQLEIEIGGRSWTLSLFTVPGVYRGETLPARSSLMLPAGSSLSLALGLLVFVIAKSRDRSERRAVRLGHLYHAQSEINQAIVRMDREEELLPLVCRMAVQYGGMTMAWVGKIDADTGRVVCMASFGEGTDYIQPDIVLTEAEEPGPVEIALQENRPVIINDYLAATTTPSRQQSAREYGWRSAAAIPLQRGGKAFAVLKVYHCRAGAFDDDVTNLLLDMAGDISFSLDNFDREAQRIDYEQALKENETMLSTIMESIGACIYLKDVEGRYLFANQQVLDLWGVSKEKVVGASDDEFFDSVTAALVRENDRRVLENGEVVEAEEVDTVRETGITRTFWSVKIPMRKADGTLYGLCGISTDITERKHNLERIRFLSNYDTLTGLPNRDLLRDKARFALETAKAQDSQVALLCIDLDRFKLINDSLGLLVGDLVLKAVAQRLTRQLHLDATLCRIGGDELFLLLPNHNQEEAEAVALRLLELIAEPLEVKRHRLSLTASIGVAVYPRHGRDFEQLTQAADAALFKAKQSGRNNFKVFAELMRAQADEILLIEHELRDALANEHLSLYYQPQISMQTGAVTGVEALLRWQHPEIGFISPSRFIPVAEESGLILELGSWVLRTAARQQALWCSTGVPVASMAVNLSAGQVYKDGFAEMVAGVLEQNQLPPAMLDLELTERIAMEHSSKTLTTLTELQELGVTLSIDDFGTGYSSLSYLKRYPINKLKIDKSFVDGVGDDPEDQAIVLAIIGIARALGFRTVAEGVETAAQWQFLHDHGCDEYQGYYFSRALPVQELEALLRAQPPADSVVSNR
ncbi:bifunctional diguanylate cyclase/phosphodiesterase [Kineobactrum salinum]|uniref:cyclic-guanylate-specific phosphodiesterase n=1 Tax=Kineobactrum salinum TaxID=2708301 RepID=A0A6C0U2U7_9GAMM|nr:EAL domain-containing protein [Kineobactrum salinum]QIB66258.1 EAL domain-containing protein [Kineobactrum salinum]